MIQSPLVEASGIGVTGKSRESEFPPTDRESRESEFFLPIGESRESEFRPTDGGGGYFSKESTR